MSDQEHLDTLAPDAVVSDTSGEGAQSARFTKRWTNLPRRTAPVSGPDAYLQLKHERTMVRQRETEREHRAFTAQRRNMIDELDWLFSMSEDPRVHFMRLHEKPTGSGVAMSLVLRYAFAAHLDRVRAEKMRNTALGKEMGGCAPDLLGAARAALAQADPEAALIVEQTCFRRPSLSERLLAHQLNVHYRTVGRRKWTGLRYLRRWIEERCPSLDNDPVVIETM